VRFFPVLVFRKGNFRARVSAYTLFLRLTLFATRNALPVDFQNIIGLLEAREIDAGLWITHRSPLAAVLAVFTHWTEPESGVLKASIELG
jgi:threonine dehydrogenase-like Zn-dependent dehydrogenase